MEKFLIRPDVINGTFEILGGILCWLNVLKLYKEKYIAGIYWPVQGFFTVWGFWNLYFYPSLRQWYSFAGGIFLVISYTTWCAMAAYYPKANNPRQVP